ncbi:MAG: hypothetical protein WEB09_03220 [Nitriliruptor sp.]
MDEPRDDLSDLDDDAQVVAALGAIRHELLQAPDELTAQRHRRAIRLAAGSPRPQLRRTAAAAVIAVVATGVGLTTIQAPSVTGTPAGRVTEAPSDASDGAPVTGTFVVPPAAERDLRLPAFVDQLPAPATDRLPDAAGGVDPSERAIDPPDPAARPDEAPVDPVVPPAREGPPAEAPERSETPAPDPEPGPPAGSPGDADPAAPDAGPESPADGDPAAPADAQERQDPDAGTSPNRADGARTASDPAPAAPAGR